MKKSFTFVEIMVVMVVIGVVLSLALVNVDKLFTAESLNASAVKLDNAFSLARGLAVGSQTKDEDGITQYIAIIMPDTYDFAEQGGEPCRSYRICKVIDNGSNYEFSAWIDGQDWERLNSGVVIAGALTYGTAAQRENVSDSITDSSIDEEDLSYQLNSDRDGLEEITQFYDYSDTKIITDVEGNDGDEFDCLGLVFNRYGNIINASDFCILLTEGMVESAEYDGSGDLEFRFKNIYQHDGDQYISNWVEMPINIFRGKPDLRFRGQDK